MSNHKETERADLHKTIWRIANDLRGSVDGRDFRTYVLGMLFYRFISENLTSSLNLQERKAGNPDFDYTTLGDVDAEFGRAEIKARRQQYEHYRDRLLTFHEFPSFGGVAGEA
ncbi:MAG: type I restriction-modification system subunit M N-terminal domain-containing protein [Desulfuromonadales bacterium]|nr:type I restriction-modification system subunit M N-terminal domain-containing protein [Desulfuromonadales bacterium]